MANSSIEIKKENVIVHIDGPAVIDYAAQIHQVFCDALKSKKSIILDLENITECDSTFIQLLRSLCFTMRKDKCSLSVYKNVLPESMNNILNAVGFHANSSCTRMNNYECALAKLIKPSEQKQEVQL